MGGAHDHGNATASAEFNIWLDPEAARIVVNCGRPIRMVPLDATHRALVSLEDAERLRALGTPAGEAAYRFISKRIEGYDATQPMHRAGRGAGPRRARGVRDHRPLGHHDPVRPRRRRDRRRAVRRAGRSATSGSAAAGEATSPCRRTSQFALDADEPKFVAMLLDILGRTA